MHEGSYCTYIMASRSRTIYIGVTANLHQRVFEHKWKERDGFTARYNCHRLVWFENFQYIQKSIAREKELKGWRSAKKIAPRPNPPRISLVGPHAYGVDEIKPPGVAA